MALKWFRLAATQGDEKAQNGLGCLLCASYLAQERAEGLAWLQKAARKGNLAAQDNLKKMGLKW